MVDVVLQGVLVLYCINKDEGDESLPLLGFRRNVVNVILLNNAVGVIFLIYSKEGISSSNVGIRNIPSHVYYDDTKHYQV